MLWNLVKRLASLENEFVRVQSELEELRCDSANMIRLAVVESSTGKSVDLKTGDNRATNIPFFVLASGKVSQYRRPSVGEQCLLINLGCGDNLNNAVALMGLPSSMFPCPTTAENEVLTDYGNGMSELYNITEGSMVSTYPGGLKITAPGGVEIIADMELTGNTNRTGDLIHTGNIISTGAFNHAGAFAVSPGVSGSPSTFSGGMAIDGGDVIVDGISVKLHFHIDAENRPVGVAQ